MKKVCALVPAHNEAKVIDKTLQSLLRIFKRTDIYVVSDGSSDQTAAIARKYTPNVLELSPNVGKATALNRAISFFKLPWCYRYLMPMDADTLVAPDFLKKILPIFNNDKNNKIICVVGKVVGISHNWITTYRIWEYEIAQALHKSAQSKIDTITVCPGCSTVYRASIFQKMKIPSGTLTEDMDFTFALHRHRIGQIVYTDQAKVFTQDPATLKDYLRQIDRWYVGFWQCLFKHHIPWKGQRLDLEVAMLATEGLFNGILVVGFVFLIPLTLVTNPLLLIFPFVTDLLFFLLPTMVLTAYKHRLWKIFIHLPHIYLIRFLSCLYFLKSFIKVALGTDHLMIWSKASRYQLKSI